MVKKKNKKINPIIYLLICACLLFVVYNSISIFLLGLFGETTMGVLTSYDNRVDDQKAAQNQSRTISKGYSFTVKGQEYQGHVMYKSDEAWPRLAEGESRRERIRYLAILPYINKPEHLVDFAQLGFRGILFYGITILGCGFLFLLLNRGLPQRKKQAKKRERSAQITTRRDERMFCHNCGEKLPEEAAFCANCGTQVQKKLPPGICQSCGAKLLDDADFCTNCGTQVAKAKGERKKASAQVSFPQRDNKPVQSTTDLVGWSTRSKDPEILEAARKNKKTAIGCSWILLLIFPAGFLLAGLLMDDMPLGEGLIIGSVLGVLMLVINMMRIRDMKRPSWEGVVTEKYKKERREHKRKDDSMRTYTEYITVIKTDAGKEKKITEKDSRRDMYDYLTVGDRVRYHPNFGTYEKYDKSQDRIIYCNVCSMLNPISNDRCKRCNNLLFK